MKKLSIIQRNKNSGSKIWYLRTFDTDAHTIKYKSLNTTVKYKAEQALEKQKQKIFLNPEEEKLENLPPLKELYSFWIKYVESNFKELTAINYRCKIKHFFDYCDTRKIIYFKDFTAINANEIINDIQGKTTTKRNYKMVYQSFFKWILDNYDINKTSAFSKVKIQKIQPPIRSFWTLEQIDQIIKSCKNSQVRLSFAFMAYCGLRVFEVLNLSWENIKDTTIEIINGKGGKNATLPLSKKLKKEIELYRNSSPCLNGKIFTIKYHLIKDELKRCCKRCKIDGHCHVHKFRHSFASNLLRNGANIVATSKLMRHSSPSMTLNIYSHIMPNDLESTLKLLDDT